MPQISKGFSSIRSLGEVLESPDVEANSGKKNIDEVTGVVTFEKVSFSYPHAERNAITDLSLSVKPGEMIALVGPSGSGKSTLINLVIGFLRPQVGSVAIDGKNMSNFNLSSYRKFISVVPQESVLFEGSVRENITYGLGAVSDERVEAALRAANAWEFVNELQDRVDTLVGERGVRLSGGQRQRIGIARALYKEADVIVFDEATSALDNETEETLIQTIESLRKDITILMIAHRLTTLRNCTQIIELGKNEHGQGGIARILTYSELIQN
jgi:ATP-binding cassette subfamily B protein